MKLLAKLEKGKTFWFLLATLFGFFLLRLPSLFEPYWYGDEGIYEVIGYALRHGRLLYQGIWDNKPPLLYIVFSLFDGQQGGARFLSLLFGLAAVLTFYFLAKKIFVEKKAVYITTGIFAFLFATPLVEGNIANAENFMVFPIVLAGYFVLRHFVDNTQKSFAAFFWAGVLLGIAFLFKIVALFDLGAFMLFAWMIFFKEKNSFFTSILKTLPVSLGFVIPVLVTIFYFALHGILGEFIHSTFSSNVSYVNYGNTFIIPQGLLILKLLLLAGFSFWVFLKRKALSTSHIFVLLWLAFSLFNAFFSERPYTHYLLVLIASISLFAGIILVEKHLQKQLAVVLLVVLFFVLTNFWIYGKTLGYYANFVGFITGTKSVTAYRTFFDKAAPRDYDIVMFFNRHHKQNERLFVWGDDGQIYRLANMLPLGRFIVAYHMDMSASNIHETQVTLAKNQPKFIVILPNQPPLPYSLSNYSEIVIIDGAVMYERDY